MAEETQQNRIAREVRADLINKSDERLLLELHNEASNATDSETVTNRTLARFASLLTVVSRKAEESSKRNEQVQQRIEKYSSILLITSFALLAVGFIQIVAMLVQFFITIRSFK